VTANSISIGLIRDRSGPAAGQYTGIVPSAQARIALQNAEGGAAGRKIHLIVKGDATNPSTNQAFVPVPSSGRPIWGKDLPNSNQSASS
jgi:ABC-type branched-subunit amino acid transport system substrate-binding protein